MDSLMSIFLDALDELHADKVAEVDECPTGSIKLLKTLEKWVDGWALQPGQTDNLRASGMYGLCPREFVLNYWQPKPHKSFDYKSQLMMSIGSHVHDMVQNRLLGPMGILWGKWESKIGKEVMGAPVYETVEGYHPDPERALWEIQHQEKLTWKFIEEQVWDEKHRIAGHMDGRVSLDKIEFLMNDTRSLRTDIRGIIRDLQKIKDKERILFELKTSGNRVFDKIDGSGSIADYYRQQASIYQALSGIVKSVTKPADLTPPTYKTLFWYLNRDTMKSKAMIYNFEEKWWTEAKRKARIIWKAIRDETLPDDMSACRTAKDERAKKCVFVKQCFGHRFDFASYVKVGKINAHREGRTFLNLKDLKYEGE